MVLMKLDGSCQSGHRRFLLWLCFSLSFLVEPMFTLLSLLGQSPWCSRSVALGKLWRCHIVCVH